MILWPSLAHIPHPTTPRHDDVVAPPVGLDGFSPRDLRRSADLSRLQARLCGAARAEGNDARGSGVREEKMGQIWWQWTNNGYEVMIFHVKDSLIQLCCLFDEDIYLYIYFFWYDRTSSEKEWDINLRFTMVRSWWCTNSSNMLDWPKTTPLKFSTVYLRWWNMLKPPSNLFL